MSVEESKVRLKQTGRNEPCPCGSGKKYKKCHRPEDEGAVSAELAKKHAEAEQAAEQEEAEGGAHTGAKADKARLRPGKGRNAGGPRAQDQGQRNANLPRRGAV